MNPDQALKKLIVGNQSFVSKTTEGTELTVKVARQDALTGQKPFAIILGCSDSRVPAELVFNCGLGDLFVIRVAGNIVAPSQIGSIEFACQHFGTELVIVLGHTHCGAISATVDALSGDPDSFSPKLASIVDRVTPAVHPLVVSGEFEDRDELVQHAMRANVSQSVTGLQMRSRILRSLVKMGKLKIVGAEYSIETGVVDFHLNEQKQK